MTGTTSPRRIAASPPRRVVATAPGKVNLSLRVGAADARGYHALATVFQALDLVETVEARAVDGTDVRLSMDSRVGGNVPVDASNLAVRAAELLRTEFAVSVGADLLITKRVPVAGGMAGGSADAAAALVALNRLWGIDASDADLRDLGARLGADVPFALLGGTALGTGNGTTLDVLDAPAPLTWVLFAPGGELSTPEVFTAFDELAASTSTILTTQPRADAAQIAALAAGDVPAIAATLANDLEAPALQLRPDLAAHGARLREAGALRVVVSGSGPTLAALVRDREHADEVVDALGADAERCTVSNGPAPGARIIDVE